LAAQRRAPEVGPEDLLVRLFLHVLDTFAKADGGDVDEHVDAAEFAQHAFNHRVNVAALTTPCVAEESLSERIEDRWSLR
jgi:hypothetical protein